MHWFRWLNNGFLIEADHERIFLIIGADHVYTVKQFLKESGLFEVEDADKWLS